MIYILMSSAGKIFDRLLGYIVPVYVPTETPASQVSHQETEPMLTTARKALRRNLTYFLERKFRDSILLALEDWAHNSASYDETKNKLGIIIYNRSPKVASFVPSYAIYQVLVSFGFFSISQRLFVTNISFISPSLQTVFGRLRLLLLAGPFAAKKIVVDVISTRKGSLSSLSDETKRFMVGKKNFNDENPKRYLIIGPGTKHGQLENGSFDSVIFLVTGNSSLEEIKLYQSKCPVIALLNAEFLLNDFQDKDSSDWKEAIGSCAAVYSKPSAIAASRSNLDVEILSAMSNFTYLWGSVGQANLLQWAVGLAIGLENGNVQITIDGADLYASKRAYISERKEQLKTEFRVSSGLAGHGTVANFLFMKKLWNLGLIKGGKDFLDVISKDLAEYLLNLDEYVGRARS